LRKKITIVGAGVSGRALAQFAARQGNSVFVTDTRGALPEETFRLFNESAVDWECGGHTPRCCECDLMLVSSGVSEKSPAVVMARERSIPVMGELDFLAPFLHGKLIAVTGTNGKTTCTSLIAHILCGNGINAVAAGNIGEPLASHAGPGYDAIVMELSSFQLHWNTTFCPDIAVLTNLAPDHIDWHGSYENYVADKCRIFNPKETENYAIVHERDRFRVPPQRTVVTLGSEDAAYRVTPEKDEVFLYVNGSRRCLFHQGSLPIMGTHNLENAAMSAAAAVLAFKRIDIDKTLPSFQAPRHRCEKICIKSGVVYVDDSKGTNVAAAITALRSIDGRKTVILGGQGKGESYEELAAAVYEQDASAIVIGSETPAIVSALKNAGCTKVFTERSMEEAVKRAAEIARPGETVLLSPACTSWDMYRNYKERGDHFAELVRKLP